MNAAPATDGIPPLLGSWLFVKRASCPAKISFMLKVVAPVQAPD